MQCQAYSKCSENVTCCDNQCLVTEGSSWVVLTKEPPLRMEKDDTREHRMPGFLSAFKGLGAVLHACTVFSTYFGCRSGCLQSICSSALTGCSSHIPCHVPRQLLVGVGLVIQSDWSSRPSRMGRKKEAILFSTRGRETRKPRTCTVSSLYSEGSQPGHEANTQRKAEPRESLRNEALPCLPTYI